MSKCTYILVVVTVFVAGLSVTGWSIENRAIENPSIRNPAGVGTVPPSSLGSGLVTSPNPIDSSGNLTVTGNVRRGRHFRGSVPYSPTTSFGAGLGSASLDSFLRDSAGYEDFGRYRGRYNTQPYYSWTNTVPTTAPGRSGVLKPVDSRVGGRAPDVSGLEALRKKKVSPDMDTSISSMAMRSKPLTPEEIDRLASGRMRVRQRDEPLSAEQYRKQIEQLRLELIKARSKTPVVQTTTDTEKESVLKLLLEPGATRAKPDSLRDKQLATTRELLKQLERTKRPQTQDEPPREQKKTEQGGIKGILESDILDKGPLKDLPSPYRQEGPDGTSKIEKGAAVSTADLEKLAEQIAALRRQESGLYTSVPSQTGTGKTDPTVTDVPDKYQTTGLGDPRSELLTGTEPGPGTVPSTTPGNYTDIVLANQLAPDDLETLSEVEKLKNLSPEEVSSRARQILGPYKTHESFSQARFKRSMTEAQALMKQGRYYQAVNAFAQASIFDSKKPEALAGRSLALFGAGEYISSALFLSRAIEMSDEYARSKIDLTAALGDKDKLDSRIADAEEWLERSCASELEFLLAYMYYHTGRFEPAKEAIETAHEEMPKSKAVKTLKEVIDAALKPPKVK
ncbi:MAG: hypothetical protein ISS79_11305 [Phycisphaerae bacterium]|nr:hypothetical protein [Phycisphaerae bacterium]